MQTPHSPKSPAPTPPRWFLFTALTSLLVAFAYFALAENLAAQVPPARRNSYVAPHTGTTTTTTETVTATETTTPTETATETPTPTNTLAATDTPTATRTATGTPSPTATPTGTRIFSCCEKDIELGDTNPNIRVKPHKNKLAPNQITITLDFEVDLKWFCRKRDEVKCRVYYEVSTGSQPWFEHVKKEWKKIPWQRVDETIIPAPPLERNCNGRNHKGTWTFSIVWVIQSGRHVQNPDLRVRLRFPEGMEKKGKQYTIVMSVDADRTDPRPTVKILRVTPFQPK